MSRRAARALAALALAAAACATPQEWIYEKPGLTTARLDHDMTACRKEALDRFSIALLPSQRVDREAFNRCMERKGYAVTPAP